MIKSMTGFGRGEALDKYQTFNVEVKTVNHRYNDIFIKMPRHLSYLEENLKQLIKKYISRGRVEIFVKLEYNDDISPLVMVDIPFARSYKEALERLNSDLDLNERISMDHILRNSEVLRVEKEEVDEDLTLNTLEEALEKALEGVLDMREKEGLSLLEDIRSQLGELEEILDEIEKHSYTVVEEYREKLESRIKDLLGESVEVDQDKLTNELVFYADKADINEELVRFRSHIGQFIKIMESEDAVGRKLDFLIQEMNREINTVGSKSNNINISSNVVRVKAIIEKMREQVQNIE